MVDDPFISLSPDDARIARDLAGQFRNALNSGKRCAAEDYVQGEPGGFRSTLLLELLRIELHWHAKRGAVPERSEYEQRFPCDASVVAAAFHSMGQSSGESEVESGSLSMDDTHSYVPQIHDRTVTGPAEETPRNTAPADRTEMLGDYELLEERGRGGMGVVYAARQCAADRLVALKVIRPERVSETSESRQRDAIQRFRTEATAAARLEHDHIVPVYDVGEVDGQHYYAMRLVQGRSLSDVCREGPVPILQAVRWIESIARALEEAHAHGILHRDVKPSNILIDQQSGRAMITDFGLAKLTEGSTGEEFTLTGDVLGSPPYMSPEQVRDSSSVTTSSDVYSLGATLYQLLTGTVPFTGTHPAQILQRVLESEPVSPRSHVSRIPRDLENICLKCLEKDPRRRYASAGGLAADLRRFMENRPVLARPVGPVVRTARWCRRHPLAGVFSGMACVLSVSFLVYWLTRPAYLEIRVFPPDAKVMVEGSPVLLRHGRSTLRRGPGAVRVEVSATGFRPEKKTLRLSRGRDNIARLDVELISDFGRFQLDTLPRAARVEVLDSRGDIVESGTTPYLSSSIRAGAYQVRISRDLFETAIVEVNVPDGGRLKVVAPVELAELAETAALARLRKFRDLLDRPLEGGISFDQIPLRETINILGRRAGTQILVDEKVLEESAADLQTPVTLDLPGATLQLALERILRPVDLTFTVWGEQTVDRLIITTTERERTMMIRVQHPVSDLIDESVNLSTREMLTSEILNLLPGPWRSMDGSGGAIESSVSPGYLAVLHTWTIQVQIDQLLDELREVRRSAGLRAKGDKAPGRTREELYRAVQAILRTPVSRRWPGEPLTLPAFVEAVSRSEAIPLRLDHAAFTNSPPEEIQLPAVEAATPTTLQEALRSALHPAGLTVVPVVGYGDPWLQITTREAAAEKLTVVAYRVAPLIGDSARFADWEALSWSLHDLPGTWLETHGTGGHAEFHQETGTMIVRQTWAVHEALLDWLDQPRKESADADANPIAGTHRAQPEPTLSAEQQLADLEAAVGEPGSRQIDDPATRRLRRELAALMSQHAGTPEALRAAKLASRIPWPVDALSPAQISPGRLSGIGDLSRDVVAVFGSNHLTHPETIQAVRYLQSGKLLVSADSKRVKVWDAGTGALLRSHLMRRITSLAVAQQGTLACLGIAGDEGACVIMDLLSGEVLHTLRGHSGQIRAAVPEAQGGLLVTGDAEGNLRWWNTADGSLQKLIRAHTGPILDLQRSPDGSSLVSAGKDTRVQLWSIPKQELLSQWRSPDLEAVQAAAFSPDGTRIMAFSGKLILWDVKTGKQLPTPRLAESRQLQPEDPLFFVGGRLFDARSCCPVSLHLSTYGWTDERSAAAARIHAFSPTRQEVVVTRSGRLRQLQLTGVVEQEGENQAVSWGRSARLIHPETPDNWDLHAGAIRDLAVSPDGELLAAGATTTIGLWDLRTGRPRYSIPYSNAPNGSVVFGPEGRRLYQGAAFPRSWNLTEFDLQARKYSKDRIAWPLYRDVERFSAENPHQATVRTMDRSENGKLIATGSHDQTIRVWDVGSRELIRVLTMQSFPTCVRFDRAGRLLAASGGDGVVTVWRVADGTLLQQLRHPEEFFTFAVDFSADGRLLASCGIGKRSTIRVWDLEQGTLRNSWQTGLNGSSLAFSPDGETLACGLTDGLIELYETDSFEKSGELRTHRGDFLVRIVFTPEGRHLLCGNEDGTITALRIRPLEHPEQSAPETSSPIGGEPLLDRIESAGGVLDEATGVAIAPRVPLKDVQALCQLLESEGLVPVRLRPWKHEGKPFAAMVWSPQQFQTKLLFQLTYEEHIEQAEALRERGYVPVDVAGLDLGGDRYFSIWSAGHSGIQDVALTFGAPSAERSADFRARKDAGFSPMTIQMFLSGNGQSHTNGVWYKSPHLTKTSRLTRSESSYEEYRQSVDEVGYMQADIDICVRSRSDSALRCSGVWHFQPGVDLRELRTNWLTTHQEASRSLARQGYRPLAVSAEVPDPKSGPVVCSLWWKAKISD